MFQGTLIQGFVWHDNMYLEIVSKFIHHDQRVAGDQPSQLRRRDISFPSFPSFVHNPPAHKGCVPHCTSERKSY